MENYRRSDLICEDFGESVKLFGEDEYIEEEKHGFEVSRLVVRHEDTLRALGKPRGKYVTVYSGKVWELDDAKIGELTELIAEEIRSLCKTLTGKETDHEFGVLVAGLGNADITPDAIGPLCVKDVLVTRHVKDELPNFFRTYGKCQVSALAPGVLGQTGIETLELIRGAVGNVKPDAVIAIDALVARSVSRLAATFQLSDTGINPGSGIGNNRKAITGETVGVPVISLGIPTVVDSSTLVYDALKKAGIEEIGDDLRDVLENGRGFFVSPKESDIITKKVAQVLSDALNIAFSSSAEPE